jgi:hypothetical protein
MTKVGLYAIGSSTTLESNKSLTNCDSGALAKTVKQSLAFLMTYSSTAVQIHSATRSAAMIMVACVLARVTCGKIEPSTIRRPARPCTRPY